jgi:hypothetical protein
MHRANLDIPLKANSTALAFLQYGGRKRDFCGRGIGLVWKICGTKNDTPYMTIQEAN